MANPSTLPVLLLGLAAILYGLHTFATWADRDTRRRRRLDEIKERNAKRDMAELLGRAGDRAQPEAVDAMVLRHLRGPHGKDG
jgi:hypothetical protein